MGGVDCAAVRGAGGATGADGGDAADGARRVLHLHTLDVDRALGERSGRWSIASAAPTPFAGVRDVLSADVDSDVLTQAVSHILDLDQLLDRILELIFNSIPADHGCVMDK